MKSNHCCGTTKNSASCCSSLRPPSRDQIIMRRNQEQSTLSRWLTFRTCSSWPLFTLFLSTLPKEEQTRLPGDRRWVCSSTLNACEHILYPLLVSYLHYNWLFECMAIFLISLRTFHRSIVKRTDTIICRLLYHFNLHIYVKCVVV